MAGRYARIAAKLGDPSHDLHPHRRGSPACHMGAWVDMILNAEWREGQERDVGTLAWSTRFMAARWCRSLKWVNTFVRELEKCGRITRERPGSGKREPTIITICNYRAYQVPMGEAGNAQGNAKGYAKGNAKEHKEAVAVTDPEVSNTNLARTREDSTVVEDDAPWPNDLSDVDQAVDELGLRGTDLDDPGWWEKIAAWVESESEKVYLITELKAYIAHQESQSGRKKHKNRKRGFRNWLSTKLRWIERDEQREAARKNR